jgi:hypothetical protein
VGRAELPTRLVSCGQDSRALREVNEQHFAGWSKPRQDAKAQKKAIFSRDATNRHARKTITDVANATHNHLNAEVDHIDRVIANTQISLTTADKMSAKGLMLELTVASDGSVLGASRIAV